MNKFYVTVQTRRFSKWRGANLANMIFHFFMNIFDMNFQMLSSGKSFWANCAWKVPDLFVNLFNMFGQIPCRDERAVANWTQMRHFQAIKLVTQSHQFVTQRLVFGPIGTLGLRVQIPPESLKQILNDGYSYPSKPVLWITCKLHKLVWQSLIQLLLLSDR